jgi:hypothetical protein
MPIENLDCYFTIARQHMVCEDYALINPEPIPHIIVCDGCSTSNKTDIGARILATSASKALREYFETTPPPDTLPPYSDLGYAIVNRARHVAELLGIPLDCLDATALLAFPYHGAMHVYTYGDGYIITIDQEGSLSYRQLSYEQNMPYYLSYWMDQARRDAYLTKNRDGKAVLTVREYDDTGESITQVNYNVPSIFSFEAETCVLVALASDGVASFSCVHDQQRTPVKEILEQLVAYKTTKGKFVKRRVKRMIKDYAKQGIYPTDDVAVATLLISR